MTVNLNAAALSSSSKTQTTPDPEQVENWVRTFNGWGRDEQIRSLRALLSVSSSCVEDVACLLAEVADERRRKTDFEIASSCHATALPGSSEKVDFITLLPGAVSILVLEFLPLNSLTATCCVSMRWYKRICSTSLSKVWMAAFSRCYMESSLLKNPQTTLTHSWKELCDIQGRSRLGWLHLPIKRYAYTGHKDRVRFAQICGKVIVSSSWDRSLRMIRLDTEAKDRQSKHVASHSGSVFGLWFNGSVAVTCSEDSTISIWNVLNESTCVAKLIGHFSAVYRVVMITKEILISCCRDFIGVWHWSSGSLLHKLIGHQDDVHRVQASSHLFVTGSYDCTVRVWSYPECKSLWASRPCHKRGVSCLHFSNNILATGSAKGQVFLWDLLSGQELHESDPLRHNETTVSCILVSGSKVFSASSFSLRQTTGIVCVWDALSGQLLSRLVENFHINAFKPDFRDVVFCACSDGVLRIRMANNHFTVKRELVHGQKPLYDVDVQGSMAVTCGLHDAVVLWTLPEA